MRGKTFSQPYDIRVPYKQGPWSHSSVHGSEVLGLQEPLEGNAGSVQCSYLSQVKNNTQKWLPNLKNSLWHTCTMPFYTTLFPKTTKDQCESCWIISEDMFETAIDVSGIFNRNTSHKTWRCSRTKGYRTVHTRQSAVFIFSSWPTFPLFLCSKGQHCHHTPNFQIMLTQEGLSIQCSSHTVSDQMVICAISLHSLYLFTYCLYHTGTIC